MEVDDAPPAAPEPEVSVAPAPPTFAVASKGFGFATPFTAPVVVAEPVAAPAPKASAVVAVAAKDEVPFISAPTGTKRTRAAAVAAAKEDEDDSDDEAMPSIVMESDEE
mgnify:CR=1 FL=1